MYLLKPPATSQPAPQTRSATKPPTDRQIGPLLIAAFSFGHGITLFSVWPSQPFLSRGERPCNAAELNIDN
jgi:hypothetical protein